jgi:hypothetical protein
MFTNNLKIIGAQFLKEFGSERANDLVLVSHISDKNLPFLFKVLSHRKWCFHLNTWVMDESASDSKKIPMDTQYWIVCWKEADGQLVIRQDSEESDQR